MHQLYSEDPILTHALKFERIQAIRMDYYQNQLQDAYPVDVQHYVNQTTLESWKDPNLTVGTGLVAFGQRYANPKVSIDADELNNILSFCYSADNASSSHRGLIGQAEIAAKLHLPTEPLMRRRYRTIRELVGNDPNTMGTVLGLAMIGAKHQPVTAYVLDAEEMSRETLCNAGLQQDKSFSVPAMSRRRGIGHLMLLKFTAENGEDVVNTILTAKNA